MSDAPPVRPAPEDVSALIARIDDSWREFLASLDDIPDERLEEPGAVGEWSLKNLFGHIGYWDDLALRNADAALAGQSASFDDWEELNEADHAARRGRTLPEERAAMHQAHAALLERLEGIAGIEAAMIDEAIKGASYEHYDEHTIDVRDWRDRVGA
jgi:hypothetical protein